MKTLLRAFIVLGLIKGQLLFGNGFVKDPSQYYAKISMGQTLRDTKKSPEIKIHQVDQATRFYGEYGLDLPWKSQIILSSVYRAIDTKDSYKSDSFKSAAVGDTDVELKSFLGHVKIGSADLLFSSTFGLNLATTNKKFSNAQVEKRHADAPSGRELLITGIDNGTNGFQFGIGSSLLTRFFWMNLSQKTENDFNNRWANLQSTFEIGSPLPWNSWIQIGLTQFRSSGSSAALTRSTHATTVSKSGSLGLTFYQGMAVELGYSAIEDDQKFWQPHSQFEVGFSARTI